MIFGSHFLNNDLFSGISDKRDQIQRAFWTGLNDLKKEGDFYWLNGTQKVRTGYYFLEHSTFNYDIDSMFTP